MVLLIVLIILALFLISYRSSYDSFPKIAQEVADATIMVKAIDTNNNTQPLGSGFIVHKKGYILTAKHNFEFYSNNNNLSMEDFISNFGYVQIQSKDGKIEDIKIRRIENIDLERKDVLLLKMEGISNLELNIVKIAKKEEVYTPGLEIGFIGYASEGGSQNTVDMFFSKGILSNKKLDLEGQTEPFYTVNAFATFGNSGGPVFLSKNGKVIGLIEQGSSDKAGRTGIVFVPPIHEVLGIINELEK